MSEMGAGDPCQLVRIQPRHAQSAMFDAWRIRAMVAPFAVPAVYMGSEAPGQALSDLAGEALDCNTH